MQNGNRIDESKSVRCIQGRDAVSRCFNESNGRMRNSSPSTNFIFLLWLPSLNALDSPPIDKIVHGMGEIPCVAYIFSWIAYTLMNVIPTTTQ